MLDNLSPLSNSTSALLESWIWSEYSHGYFLKFPHTGADVIAHLLFVFAIHTRQQVKHEINSYWLHTCQEIISNLKCSFQCLKGAGKMALATGQHPGQLKDAVTSPGGTTIAGMLKF